jgi:YaaC-like protein
LRSTLGMEEWIEGRDIVVFRAVSKELFRTPWLRSPLRGQPHMLEPRLPGHEWQISEVATMLLAMFILGDLARYRSNLWMDFISHPSFEVEAVRAFVDIVGSKFPFLVLNHLRREYLHFAD